MKINIRKTIILSAIYVLVVLSGAIIVNGSATDKISGWAWSDNIGWISLNCTNTDCSNSNYGVTVNLSTGNFSGYAWSDTIGWINFAPTIQSPADSVANYNSSTGRVTGWIRAVSYGGGWDGWIKLGDSSGEWKTTNNTQVKINSSTKELEGWAWGSDVVGWISFNCLGTSSCE
ncbi:MAG: hypothetical protein V1686_00485 [Patescibacteria group bacterium]